MPRNSVCGFLGPNGAGKTTTLKLLLGLVRATEGCAYVLGLDCLTASTSVRSSVGYLAQEPTFPAHMTPRQVLRFVLTFFPTDGEHRIADTLARMGLARQADRPVGELSGGQRQRLGIAQAIVHQPEVLLLDEPLAFLDPIGRREMLDLLLSLGQRATVLFSTHILDDVERVCDRVAVLNAGHLLAQGAVTEVLQAVGASTLEDAFLTLLEGRRS